MSIIQSIRKIIRKNIFFRKMMAYYIVPSGFFDKKVLALPISKPFQHRITEVLSCPDNEFIPRVENAGCVKNGKQIMHNGIKVHLGSYYGPEVAQQLYKNKGVHEPQEEYVFQEVLKYIPNGATMIELGAFWAFYSIWFQRSIPNAINYMVEPDSFNLGCGIRNFKLNNLNGNFTKAFVSKKNSIDEKGNRTIGIDDFCKEKNIDFIDILHCDIQGYEYEMLMGASLKMQQDKIGYFFISTHSDEVHYKCLHYFEKKGYIIIAASDLKQTFAEDGLIVAKSQNYKGIEKIQISLKKS